MPCSLCLFSYGHAAGMERKMSQNHHLAPLLWSGWQMPEPLNSRLLNNKQTMSLKTPGALLKWSFGTWLVPGTGAKLKGMRLPFPSSAHQTEHQKVEDTTVIRWSERLESILPATRSMRNNSKTPFWVEKLQEREGKINKQGWKKCPVATIFSVT